MSISNRTRGAIIGLALAGALGASLAGGAVASAAATSGGGTPALFDQFRGPQLKDILAGLVTKGTITQAQADAITAAVQAARPTPPARPSGAPPAGRPAPGHGFGLAFGGPFLAHQTALTYLGITQQQLMDQLKTGRSLGEVAAATPGKTRDGLIAALTSAASTRIDKAVTDGKLSAADATAAKAKLAERIQLMVDAKIGPRPAPPKRP